MCSSENLGFVLTTLLYSIADRTLHSYRCGSPKYKDTFDLYMRACTSQNRTDMWAECANWLRALPTEVMTNFTQHGIIHQKLSMLKTLIYEYTNGMKPFVTKFFT
jgi:hypothetical protein